MAEPPPTPPERVLVIANPIAGSGQGERLARELVLALEREHIAAELRLTEARGDAARFASEARADAVVSLGGDGTLNEVLRGLAGRELPIAILPLGTANVLARDLGLTADPAGTVRALQSGRTLALDTALVNGELSFLAVGAGFDAEAVHRVDAHRRGPIRMRDYVVAGCAALWSYREPRLEVELDGERLPGTFGWVLVSNVINYGGVFRLAPDRDLGDGLWEVYLFERAARRHLLAHGWRALTGALPGGGCVRRRARRVRLTSPFPVHVQVDGDARGTTPVDMEVSGPRFRIFRAS